MRPEDLERMTGRDIAALAESRRAALACLGSVAWGAVEVVCHHGASGRRDCVVLDESAQGEIAGVLRRMADRALDALGAAVAAEMERR
jgi:hypothetical protein